MAPKGLRALVVEDDPGTRRLLQEILRVRGHQVEACADAETGWAAFRRERADLVLLDLRLPGMDGDSLCRKIRQTPGADETVILIVTGVEDRQALETSLDAGADDYIRKPVNGPQIHLRLAIAERRTRDLTERKEVESHLRRDALHDHLTGLANESFVRERISHSVRRSLRDENYHYSVVVVDICGFSELNQQYGKDVCDRVLKELGGRLEESVRSIDSVARLTADRFAILLDGLNDVTDPTRVATRILQGLSIPFDLGGDLVHISVNLGIALSATGYESADEILRDSHSALEEAKSRGQGAYRMYDPVMHAKAMARVQLESRVREALAAGLMRLEYQPVVQLDTGRIAGLEALIRWEDGDRGSIAPERFIPLAEGSSLILSIGDWVLDTAVKQIAEWESLLSGGSPFFVSVNLSGKQFSQPDFATRIQKRLEDAGVPGDSLHVEITETALMESVGAAGNILTTLREQAIHVQIDDFGTGYSSLSYLCRLPIDTLKIDRSFVGEMHRSPENLEVVRTIVRLAHNLGMTVVAEGVETEGQLELLRDMKCDLAQGFLFSRSVRPDSIPELLERPSFS